MKKSSSKIAYSWYDSELIAAGRPIIMETLEKARANGDNVHYIDGQKVYGEEYKTCATVDGCHPNDFGFVMMADAVLKILKQCGLFLANTRGGTLIVNFLK